MYLSLRLLVPIVHRRADNAGPGTCAPLDRRVARPGLGPRACNLTVWPLLFARKGWQNQFQRASNALPVGSLKLPQVDVEPLSQCGKCAQRLEIKQAVA